MQLVLRHNMLRNELMATLRVLPTTSQTVLNKFGCCRCEKLLLQTPNSIFRRSGGSTRKVTRKRKSLMSLNFYIYSPPFIYCLYFIYARNNNTAVEIHLKA